MPLFNPPQAPAEIADLQADVTALDSAISTLQTSSNANTGAIATLQNSVSAINSTNTSQSSAIATLQSQVAALTANLTWTNLSLVNGWANYGSGLGTGQYAKANGWVFLRGVLNGVNNSIDTFAILPTGHRPAVRLILDCVAGGTGNATTAARLDVTPAGELISMNFRPPFLSLDGLAFYVGT